MWIVFIEIDAGFTRAFAAARELGLKVLWIGITPNTEFTSLCDSYRLVNELNLESVRAVIRDLDCGEAIAGAWTLEDRLVPLAAQLTLDVARKGRHSPLSTISTVQDKLALREALVATQYNPEFTVIDLNGNARVVRPFPGHTIVLKPRIGHSSIGVEKVKPDDDFHEALSRSSSVLKTMADSLEGMPNRSSDPETTVLVEKFISGEEYSAEVFAHDGKIECLGVCGKSEMTPPFFEEISYCMPAPIDATTTQRIKSAAVDIMTVLGLTSGMAHVEIKVNANEVKVLDIGLRLGGSGLTHDLIYESYGIDIVKAVIAELVGLDPAPYLERQCQDIALLYLFQLKSGGKLARNPLDRYNQGNSVPDELIEARSYVHRGDLLSGYPNYSGLPGFALFKIKGAAAQAYARADEILKIADDLFALDYEI